MEFLSLPNLSRMRDGHILENKLNKKTLANRSLQYIMPAVTLAALFCRGRKQISGIFCYFEFNFRV